MKIDKDISIEDLVRSYPKAVGFLMEKGIRCLACGEPLWGTLASAALSKGYTQQQIEILVTELKQKVKSS